MQRDGADVGAAAGDSDVGRLFLLSEEAGPAASSEARLADERDAARFTTWLSISDVVGDGARTVQGVAARLIERLRALQPRGPYRVVGFATAGIVAYEMGIQLLSADEGVELVGLVETECLDRASRQASLLASSDDGGARAEQGSQKLRRALLDYEVPDSPLVVHLVLRASAVGSARHRGWERVLRAPGQVRVVPVAAEREGEFRGAAVQALTDAVAARRRSDAAANVALDSAHRAMVTIQTGRPDVPRLLCVPGAGAGVTDFVPLATLLSADVPVQGFQARGMEGTMLPHATVQAAARAHLRELAAVDTAAGVHLVGHSFGGWIAFEMALRLQEAGRPALSLTLLDSEWPLADDCQRREYTRCDGLMKLVSLHEQAAERSLEISRGDFEGRDPATQIELLHSRLIRVGIMPPRSSWRALNGPVRAFEAAIRTRYSPEHQYRGTTTLVLVPEPNESEERMRKRMESVTAGWRTVAPQLQFVRGGGNHVRLLKPPHIAPIADLLRERLSRRRDASRPPARPRGYESAVNKLR